ncbi:NUDIX hydrolase [Kitasatospora cineracea]|uniref:8-oxo-dGTP pyrophosphatase MutT (NUDIX family) n=1 Tax=Kitasatospora cineracea TaxID=88074 RepID=A0A8G1UL01_9ACTN|nr:NUDIX hydrolase [Kitasatospora cineracea]ROR45970.1 8-oxo-dGTP pyrophosphatase MutT (NUDIX family) [Kitasatospora cineracea]
MSGREIMAAAGVLFPDRDGRVLVVRTSYRAKHPIAVPGGGWEPADPSPRHTAVREIREELGVTPVLRELACLDWSRDHDRPPIAAFLYWADPLTPEQAAAVRLEAAELDAIVHLPPDLLLSAVPPLLSRRMGACVLAPRAAAPLELADGLPVGHSTLHLPPRPAPAYLGAAALEGLLPPGAGLAAPPPPMDKQTYYATRPRVRAKARMLFTAPDGRVLLVRLTPWRDESPWVLPGGSVEADRELPRAAARREALEELGWRREPGRLLAVDWVGGHPWDDLPHLSLVYDGGTAGPELLADVRVQEEEIAEWRLFTPAEAARVLTPPRARRLAACLAVRALPPTAGPAELVDGAPPATTA